jgi:hypothetical protein
MDFKYYNSGELGDLLPLAGYAFVREDYGLLAGRLRPTQFFYEQRPEIKSLQ